MDASRPAPAVDGSTGRAAAWLALLPPVATAAVARLVPLANPDLLWQARTGDAVIASGGRLHVDTFSRALRGAPLHDHEPAFEALVAIADRTPWRLLTIWWASLAVAVLVTAAATHAARTIVPSPWARALAGTLVVFGASIRFELRADVMSFAAIAIAYAIRRGGDEAPRRLATVACAAVGIQFHGLAWLVCAVPFAFAAEAALAAARTRDATARGRLARSALVDVGLAFASVAICELLARGTLRNALANANARAFVAHVLEMQSPFSLAGRAGRSRPLVAIGVSTVAALGLASALRSRRARVADLVLLLALIVPSLRSVSGVVLPLLAAMPSAIAGVATLLETGLGGLRRPLRGAIGSLFVLGVLFHLAIDVAEDGLGAQHGGYDLGGQPVAAVRWLRENRPQASLFHAFNLGAYLVYERWPGGVVIDARGPILYPAAYTDRYYAAIADPARFEAWAREEGFDAALLSRGHKGTRALERYLRSSPDWEMPFEDARSFVFVRTAHAALPPAPADGG